MRRAVLLGLVLAGLGHGPAARSDEDAASFVRFVEEPTGTCVTRNGVQVLVKNEHPKRTLRVWLDRYQAGVGTGDRSRTDLKPNAEPEPLGCTRNTGGTQEWRLARAAFVD